MTIAAVVAAAPRQPPTAAADKIDVSKIGPQVGGRIPSFRLKDQFGQERTLESIVGPKGAMVVFFRSADW